MGVLLRDSLAENPSLLIRSHSFLQEQCSTLSLFQEISFRDLAVCSRRLLGGRRVLAERVACREVALRRATQHPRNPRMLAPRFGTYVESWGKCGQRSVRDCSDVPLNVAHPGW